LAEQTTHAAAAMLEESNDNIQNELQHSKKAKHIEH